MERKKSKQTILFPTYLDMDRFVGAEETRRQRKKHLKENKNLYELRGILLHKGASAYHGHYEAQVFDVQYVQICIHPKMRLILIVGTKAGTSSTTRR